MTGHGEARCSIGPYCVSVEIRTVNNRHLKVNVRGPEFFTQREAEIERLLRNYVRRGTASVLIHSQGEASAGVPRLPIASIQNYWQQLEESNLPVEAIAPVLTGLLQQPGLISPVQASPEADESIWPTFEQALVLAAKKLNQTRQAEGEAMGLQLLHWHKELLQRLRDISRWAPEVLEQYRLRLEEKVKALRVAEGLTPEDRAALQREILLFADRSDISEEIVRLNAHLQSIRDSIEQGGESAGRKLEFILQELAREINTVGAKANDVRISQQVVEWKATLEKIRELIQNIE